MVIKMNKGDKNEFFVSSRKTAGKKWFIKFTTFWNNNFRPGCPALILYDQLMKSLSEIDKTNFAFALRSENYFINFTH